MTKKTDRLPVVAVLLALSSAGYILRRRQLAVGFDAAGIPTGRGGALLVTVCVLAVLLAAFVALGAKTRPAFRDNFTAHPLPTALTVLAAGLLAGGSAIALMDPASAGPAERIAAALGLASGLCFVVMGAVWRQGKKPVPAAWLIPVVYCVLQTILSFKSWSTDPIILDYCFKLFALLCFMLGAFHASGFVFDKGGRKSCLFFCLTGVFFSCVTLADGGTAHMMRTAGGALFLLATGWHLLGDGPKGAPEEAENENITEQKEEETT